MIEIEIRIATYEDCAQLAILKRNVWETTYRGIYPNEKIDKYDIELNENKFKNIIKKQSQRLFIVLNNSRIIGYVSCGRIMRSFDKYTHDIGLLYLLKEYQGKGIGSQIFKFAKNELKNQGITEFIVSCNKYNFSAQQFYKKMGGKIIKIDEDNEDKSIPQVKFLFVEELENS
ncbi:GNAT family N-acetyltransferase [Clostridium ihumii]|uniref:GNAT family N-acetyltransferase n=1 Tax=Clostridium ihumii TaxID=1470356 RepID=UPI003D33B938